MEGCRCAWRIVDEEDGKSAIGQIFSTLNEYRSNDCCNSNWIIIRQLIRHGQIPALLHRGVAAPPSSTRWLDINAGSSTVHRFGKTPKNWLQSLLSVSGCIFCASAGKAGVVKVTTPATRVAIATVESVVRGSLILTSINSRPAKAISLP